MTVVKMLTYVEIDVDYCVHSYGVSPCQAALGVTGDKKCFNTFKTCQDPVNFLAEPKTLRYCEPTAYIPGDLDVVPSIKSVSYSSQRIKPGESLGERASVTAVFSDHPWSDTDLDKYYAEREYDPYSQGTYWGKFRARSPYIIGRPFRLIIGPLGVPISEMETRHFIIDSFSGPGTDGLFSLVAKDILKIADGDRAQAPRKSNGTLLADIDENDTSITLDPVGIGDLEYPASGRASIGEEMMSFTRAGDVVTITRGDNFTEPSKHDEGDLFQLALVYDSENPADLIYDLLVNFADCDPALIPLDEWTYEVTEYINRVYGAVIAAPTSVSALVNELIEQVGLVVWWNDIEQLIKMRSLRPVAATADLIDDNLIIASSLKITDQPNKRMSQIWTSYAQINPLEGLDRASNYASGAVSIDGQSEIDHGLPAIHKVNSRWIGRFNRSTATRLNAQLLSRFRDPPRKFTLAVDRIQSDLQLGLGYRLSSWALQDDTGAKATTTVIITSLTPSVDKYAVEAEEAFFFDQEDLEAQKLIVIDQSSYNINLRDVYEDIFSQVEEDTEILCIIENGVIVGSTSNLLPGFDVGDWPAGVTITIRIFGRIEGAGGPGGSVGGTFEQQLGQPGGLALLARRPVTIDNQSQIWGGGGGGGAAIERGDNFVGGAGGAGYRPGPYGNVTLAPATNTGDMALQYQPVTLATPEAGGDGGYAVYPSNWDMRPGDGGGPALPGATGYAYFSDHSVNRERAGGAAGGAVDGDSFITFTNVGEIRGTRIN